jgi:glucan 1,3-beta-glucosidase
MHPSIEEPKQIEPAAELAVQTPEPDMKPSKTKRPLRILRGQGTQIVDADGKPVVLRGCNLGNWFLLEMWMWDINDIRDQYEFEQILARRFGAAEKERLMNVFRENWIRARDYEMVRRFGFNCIRLPFHYSLLEDDERPFQLKPDAFRWLDAAVEMARKHKLYVILDLHGVPGGQSDDHTTGRAGQNLLYKNEEYRRRTAWLWGEIAKHYRDSETIAAYDLINEPYGAKSNAERLTLVALVDDIYSSIRAVDTNHLIFASATLSGFRFYGSPAERGWENFGFTQHFYPGLFGQDPTPESHALFISRTLPPLDAYLKEVQAPFLVGEFNVVFERVGGPALMRHYYDLYGERGWAATMWAYKLLKRKGGMGVNTWSLVVNKEPLPAVDIRKSSAAEIEAYFRWMGEMEYEVYENFGAIMTMKEPPPVLQLPEVGTQLHEPPAVDDPAPWTATDINHSLPGGQKMHSPDRMDVYGGGTDIWAATDQFRFLWQKVTGDFEFQATIKSLTDTHVYAKTGLMIRHTLEPSSAHLLLHVFPNAEVLTGWRPEDSKDMEQKSLATVRFPIRLRLRRKGDMLEAGYATQGKPESITKFRVSDDLRGEVYVGFAVLSHDNHCLTTAQFEDIRFRRGR